MPIHDAPSAAVLEASNNADAWLDGTMPLVLQSLTVDDVAAETLLDHITAHLEALTPIEALSVISKLLFHVADLMEDAQ